MYQLQNMILWHIDYLVLVIFKKWQAQEKLLKLSRSYPFIKDIFILKEISILKGVSFSVLQKEG